MAPHAIVSYDDTQNDHDALALGRTLRDAGARLTLAYVRHCTHRRPDDEELSQHEAEALLVRGALSLDDQSIERRVVLSASTGEGLGWLAAQEGADIVVFGSDYRTPSGRVAIGRSAQTLLEGGPAALALAPAGYAARGARDIATIGVLRGSADEAAIETAFSIAERARCPGGGRRSRSGPPGRRIAPGGPRGPGDDHLARGQRDRRGDVAGADRGPGRGAQLRDAGHRVVLRRPTGSG